MHYSLTATALCSLIDLFDNRCIKVYRSDQVIINSQSREGASYICQTLNLFKVIGQKRVCATDYSVNAIATWTTIIILTIIIALGPIICLFHILTLIQQCVANVLVSEEHDHESGKQVEAVVVHLIFKVGCSTDTLIIDVICTLINEAIAVGKG